MPQPRPIFAALGLLLVMSSSAQAQTASQTLHLRALAATCANCHGTDGAAVDGAGNVALRGIGKEYIAAQMIAYRDGKLPATVMHQIAKGYSLEQIEQRAAYFAAQK